MPKAVLVENLAAELNEMNQRLATASLEDALRSCLPVLRAGEADNFSRAIDSDGNAWPPRKEVGDGHPLLNDTGALLAAATGTGPGAVDHVEPRELAFGVDKGVDLGGLPGAAVHQNGYPPFNIPQREWLYANEETLDKSAEEFADGAVVAVFEF